MDVPQGQAEQGRTQSTKTAMWAFRALAVGLVVLGVSMVAAAAATVVHAVNEGPTQRSPNVFAAGVPSTYLVDAAYLGISAAACLAAGLLLWKRHPTAHWYLLGVAFLLQINFIPFWHFLPVFAAVIVLVNTRSFHSWTSNDEQAVLGGQGWDFQLSVLTTAALAAGAVVVFAALAWWWRFIASPDFDSGQLGVQIAFLQSSVLGHALFFSLLAATLVLAGMHLMRRRAVGLGWLAAGVLCGWLGIQPWWVFIPVVGYVLWFATRPQVKALMHVGRGDRTHVE